MPATKPKIETLVEDIYHTLEEGATVSPEEAKTFGDNLARIVSEKLSSQNRSYLRLSNLGSRCLRKLWYSVNTPELAEKLSGPARIKFLIGDITEAVVLFLAKLSGHAVADEQQSVAVHGVPGHIDCTIDGEVTDVKSASPPSFKKFQSGVRKETDDFGYLTQLGSYVQAKKGNGGTKRGHFLAVHKVLGHLHLDSHDNLPDITSDRVSEVRQVLAASEPPARGFEDEPHGASGSRKLSTPCSYCEFKAVCWPGVQIAHYAGDRAPVFLTKAVNLRVESKPFKT